LRHFRIHNTKTITRADALESGLDESLMSLLWEKTGVKFYSSHKGIANDFITIIVKSCSSLKLFTWFLNFIKIAGATLTFILIHLKAFPNRKGGIIR
jgi:hypothetical protein